MYNIHYTSNQEKNCLAYFEEKNSYASDPFQALV